MSGHQPTTDREDADSGVSPRRHRTVTWVSITPGDTEYWLPHTDTNPFDATLRVRTPSAG